MKFIVTFTFCALVSYTYAIHNGAAVEPNSIPYQVLLFVHRDGKISKCGGSLVKPDRILTAAHCLKDRDYVDVYVGAHHEHNTHEKSRQFRRVESSDLYPHPLWGHGKGYDVGIIKLSHPFKLNEYVGLVKLPYGLEDTSFVGEHALVSGWGEIDNAHDHVGALHAVTNPIISNYHCAKEHIRIDDGNICMSGKEGRRTCGGDSGGPVVIKDDGQHIQIGIVSKGEESCGGVHPSIFTRVTYYLDDFITENLE
ncbi:brachyurin-like [Chironomus tepperi]|uniref:brachyurin-like n=1 Tax=Chironomus tepperi TaxID=113505 RepID=UPI00391F2851